MKRAPRSLLSTALASTAAAVALCGSTGCSTLLNDPFDNTADSIGGTSVAIYAHDEGFTRDEAHALERELLALQLNAEVYLHVDPAAPDSIFIGTQVGAAEARAVIEAVPYEVRYIFRTDYPVERGGDLEGDLIGVGYLSSHAEDNIDEQSQPIRIYQEDLDALTEPKLSDTEFQIRLRTITRSP